MTSTTGRLLFAAATSSMLALTSAAAQPDAAECAKIDDGNERLLCYDAALRTERREVSPQTPSAWNVREDVSRIDDTRTVVVQTPTTNEFRSRFGQTQRGFLLARCMENTTVAYLGAGDHFLADIQDYGRVTYRIDQQSARTVGMSVSTDNKAIGHWSGGAAIPFLRSLFGGEELVVRVTPYNESPVTMEFNIAGLEEEIAPLREACNW